MQLGIGGCRNIFESKLLPSRERPRRERLDDNSISAHRGQTSGTLDHITISGATEACSRRTAWRLLELPAAYKGCPLHAIVKMIVLTL